MTCACIINSWLLAIFQNILCPIIIGVIGLIYAKYKTIDGWLNHSHDPGFWSNIYKTNEDEMSEISHKIMDKHRVNPEEYCFNKAKYHRGWILWYAIKTFYK